jgi:hypothetical protein
MAVTQTQQYFVDKAISQNPNECCLALDGEVIEASWSPGTMICQANVNGKLTSFPLEDSCGVVEAAAETTPTQGGGFGNWLTTNIGGIASGIGSAFGSVYSTITGTETPEQALDRARLEAEAERQRKTRQAVVGLVIFVVIAVIGFYLIKKRKK